MALNRIETDAIEDDAITTAKILDGTVGPADIGDGELTNTQINASAAIAVSKISGLGTAAALDFGTGANQILQLDGSGNLPALNASALTNIDSADLSGNLPALNASNLTNLTAANLTGALPAISGANLTGVSTDTSAMENNIAILAFKTQAANNLAKFNLVDQVIDEYKDATGVTLTTAGQSGTTATDGYLASIYQTNTVTTPSTSSDWVGLNSGCLNAFTYTSGGVDVNAGDKAIYSGWSSGTGDYTVQFTVVTKNNLGYGMFDIAHISSHACNDQGGMTGMTRSYHWHDAYYSSGTYLQKGGSNDSSAITSPADGSVIKFERISGVLKFYDDEVLIHTFTGTDSTSHKLAFMSSGTTDGDVDNLTFSIGNPNPVVSAAGTATSTANTALTAPTTGDIVMLIEEVDAVTATLNTAGNDLRCTISRNGGTGWDYVTLANKGLWGTNKKILVANGVPFSNSASGTDMRYKIEWANQVAGVAAGTAQSVIRSGDAQHSTAEQKIGASSIKFDGTGDYLTVSDIADFSVTSSNYWTMECWYKKNSGNLHVGLFGGNLWTGVNARSWACGIQYNGGNSYIRWANYSNACQVSPGAFTMDTNWHHYAVSFDAGTQRLFHDGVLLATSTHSPTWGSAGNSFRIGIGHPTTFMNGYIDEIRFSNVARYTATFTAFSQSGGTISSPTAFVRDANTKLLIHSDDSNGATEFTDSSPATAVTGHQVKVHATSLAWA
jgi:hypothetical protein